MVSIFETRSFSCRTYSNAKEKIEDKGPVIFQTDANGTTTSTAVPITSHQQQQQQQRKGAADVFYRIFCCFPSNESVARAIPNKTRTPLLPNIHLDDASKKCLVLDLDETLVHSSFKEIPNPDFVIPVEIDGRINRVCV